MNAPLRVPTRRTTRCDRAESPLAGLGEISTCIAALPKPVGPCWTIIGIAKRTQAAPAEALSGTATVRILLAQAEHRTSSGRYNSRDRGSRAFHKASIFRNR